MHPYLVYPYILAALVFVVVNVLYLITHITSRTAPEFYGRSIASFIALGLCAIYGTITSALLNLAGYGGLGQYFAARAFKWTLYAFTGIWFQVYDPKGYLEKARPSVLVSNHQTELDVAVLAHVFPPYCSVSAKKSLQKIPVLGWFMTLSKTVFIERTSRTQAVAAFTNAAEQMHTVRQSVFIFPEGTRSYYDHPDMLPFKKGAFHLAVQAQVPIIPVVVANYSNVLNVKQKLFRPVGTIPIRILKPIETKGKTKDDVDALLEEVREVMMKALKQMIWVARETGVAVKENEVKGSTDGNTARATGLEEKLNAAA